MIWVLICVPIVLYGLWVLFRFTFDMIDSAHAWRETEGRRGGSEPALGEDD